MSPDMTDIVTAILLAGALWCSHCCRCAHYLYYTSTEGVAGPIRPAGLYGGPILLRSNGTAQDLYQSGYHCTRFSMAEIYQNEKKLEIQQLSFDPISKQVTFRLSHKYLTILKGPLCRPMEECRPNVTNTRNSKLELMFWKAARTPQMGPVAFYDNTLYYVVNKQVEKEHSKHYEGSLQLHKLDGCREQFPITSAMDFDIGACSKCIATLVTGQYHKEEEPNFRSLDHMVVLKGLNGLRFLTQIQILHYNDADVVEYLAMKLLVIDEDGIVTTLHTEEISTLFSSLDLPHLGGVSYKDGVVCWSTVNKIFCADLVDNKLEKKFEILQLGATIGICAGTSGEPFTANVTTGISIADVRKDNIAVYFGCVVSPVRGVGGAGLVRMDRTRIRSRRVYPVKSDGHPIYAGSMFIADHCSHAAHILPNLWLISLLAMPFMGYN